MQFATECRERASALTEMAKQAPEFKARLLVVAQWWLTLAKLEDQFNVGVDQTNRFNLLH
jgi:hypothetical protein